MNYFLRLRPELVEDAHEAFVWYEGAATGLGHDFLRSYFVAVAAAEREPFLYRKIFRDFRRVLLDRFPYVLYFRIEGSSVVIFLLIHGARDPALIRRSLRDRKKSRA
ncbi:MAG: plasmid stabilization system protein [Pedosphaera sp.]|nr:plasmid stabilization system protein [Pedosphaera sp.]